MIRKFFKPLCLSLGFLTATGSLVSKEVTEPRNILEKYEQEIIKLIEEFGHTPTNGKTSPVSKTTTYLQSEYGPLAAPLNKFRQLLESSKQETAAGVQAFKEINIEGFFIDGVLFDLLKIIDKKKKLERLSTFLDESEKRTEKAYSDYNTWITSSPDLDEVIRKPMLEGQHQYGEKGAFFRKESYKIKKNIVLEVIKLLDFLSKIYGTYQKEGNSAIICSNDQDTRTLNSYLLTLSNLLKEDQNLTLQWQQNMQQMKQSFVEFTKMDPDPALLSKEYLQAESLLKCFNKFRELCDELGSIMGDAYAEVTANDICSEASIFDPIKLKGQKKKLERMSIILDENEKKWANLTSDLIEQTKRSPVVDDQMSRKRFEFCEKTVIPNMKKSIALTQNYVLELKKLIDFLLIRHGTYRKTSLENQEFRFSFQFEIDGKLYDNYIRNIDNFGKENHDLILYNERLMQEFDQKQ